MYIEPNTTIKLYSGVPLDNTYNHTLYFASISAQNAYFSGSQKYTLSANSYQRVERGRMRISLKADNIYDCNYLAFQNSNYGYKWFYAFITGVEYVNNETSEVTFEIDSLQTYMFDVTIKECFVEREHISLDDIGANIQPEPVQTGEYVISDYNPLDVNIADMAVLIMIADEDSQDYGDLYGGIYSGCELYAYNATNTTDIKAILDTYIEKPDQVIGLYMCPKIVLGASFTEGLVPYSTSPAINTYVLSSVSQASQTFGGYTPKNKKLYTYPYNFLRIDNASGQSLNLRYEFFDNLTPVIEVTGTFQMPVKLVARPCSYKGLPSYTSLGGYTSSKSESITLESYPMCSWNVNAFQSWLAQNCVPIALNTIANTTNSAIASQYAKHSTAMFGTSVIGNVANILSQAYSASIAADECRGSTTNGNVNVSNHYQMFYKQRCHVSRNYAEVIDNFFSMYGYATNKVKFPNISSRPHWNYIKTSGCVAIGQAPTDDIRKICSIYDNGITFWKSASEVGNYTLDNSGS